MVAVLLVFVVCLAVVLVLRVVLENVKFDLNDKPLCNLALPIAHPMFLLHLFCDRSSMIFG